jgi:hypothetical protein
MKTKYEYIHFVLDESFQSAKTTRWFCSSNSSDDVLGIVKWYAAWRQYCFFPSEDSIFNNGCLADIQDFIKQLMQDRLLDG